MKCFLQVIEDVEVPLPLQQRSHHITWDGAGVVSREASFSETWLQLAQSKTPPMRLTVVCLPTRICKHLENGGASTPRRTAACARFVKLMWYKLMMRETGGALLAQR